MSELYYSLSQQQIKGKATLVVDIRTEAKGQRRHLYKDVLQSLVKNPELSHFLIRQELYFLGISPLSGQASTAHFNQIRIAAAHSNEAVKLLAKTGRLYWGDKKIMVDPFSSVEFLFEAQDQGRQLEVRGVLKTGEQVEDLSQTDVFFPGSPTWLIRRGVWQNLVPDIDWKWVQMVFPDNKVLEGKKREQFLDQFEDGDFPRAPKVIWKQTVQDAEEVCAEPIPFLVLSDSSGAFADLWLDYGPLGKIGFHDLHCAHPRNVQAEKNWEKDLLETDFSYKMVGSSHYYCPLDKVGKSLTFLLDIGWNLFDHQGRQIVRQDQAKISLEDSGRDILVKGTISYEKHEINLAKVLGAFNRRERFVSLSPNAVGLIDDFKIQNDYSGLEEFVGDEAIRVKKNHFGLLDGFFNQTDVQFEGEVARFASHLDPHTKIEEVAPSPDFMGKLHPYQQLGLNWLFFLHSAGLGGLLADEMGLGKTVQILALISKMPRNQPILIVVPTSIVFNWRLEIEKFLPNTKIYVHTGLDRIREAPLLAQEDLIITSYAILRLDSTLLEKVEYDCIVLDEAQNIKNADSLTAACAFRLRGKMKIAVTGTPIENRLEDLWSIFHFLMPSLLGGSAEFSSKMHAAESDNRYLVQLKKKIKPFILRRTKEVVADDLPPKYEQVVWTEMSDAQRQVYEECLRERRLSLAKKIKEEGLSSQRMQILETILRLRQICCHPYLADRSLELENLEASSKLERLLEDMHSIIEERRKVLVYSQFTQMLRLIEDKIKKLGWKYVFLDGSSVDREKIVLQFQEDATIPIFLISLKAGGVGLNLTAADYVFIFDPWWNEAVERQAIDRAHRFGRTRKVIARRYVMAESIEEKMMHLKQRKSSLAKAVLESDAHFDDLTLEDLYALISD